MKLGDFKGKRGAKAFAELMQLGERLLEDGRLGAFVENVKGATNAEAVAEICKLSPIVGDDEVLDAWVSIIAKVKKLPEEEVAEDGDLMGELVELFTSDLAVGRFFASSANAGE